MPNVVDIATVINDIKSDMKRLMELQKKYEDEYNNTDDNERKEYLFIRIWELEGKINGLFTACKTIKDRFMEDYPELLEKETCEVD